MERIKAIETRYKGYRARSRLEARWMVWLDALDVSWEYEHEGFDLPGVGYYLPDFLIRPEKSEYSPDYNSFWLEVKGAPATHEEKLKAVALSEHTLKPCIIVSGTLGVEYQEFCQDYWHYVPSTGFKAEVFCGECGLDSQFERHSPFIMTWDSLEEFLIDKQLLDAETEQARHWIGWRNRQRRMIELDREYYLKEYGKEHPKWKYGVSLPGWADQAMLLEKTRNGFVLSDSLSHDSCSENLAAYDAARGARFEHGENQ